MQKMLHFVIVTSTESSASTVRYAFLMSSGVQSFCKPRSWYKSCDLSKVHHIKRCQRHHGILFPTLFAVSLCNYFNICDVLLSNMIHMVNAKEWSQNGTSFVNWLLTYLGLWRDDQCCGLEVQWSLNITGQRQLTMVTPLPCAIIYSYHCVIKG